MAYSPLWKAENAGKPVLVRRDDWGMLEVDVPEGAGEISLSHRPGAVEIAGGLLTVASALLLALAGIRGLLVSRAWPPA